ncbi:hypothetical protein [Streptacidiphilus sp. P02-A3a]|uniref:hypothetical protein n=1 Tax=Streptacidiphilus sp. P02-A3a TaxID=2704468 RepID=UPI0015F9F4AE|nr:hypothetical protein [Streptacidiphilus sp. P02-A3a]QMU71970.1 hypothetical protein GXP74_30775 [Streptacidiphilus sp. P02-A3a]
MTLVARFTPAATGWLALLLVDGLPAAAPLRMAAVTVFLLCCPGLALLRPLRPALLGPATDRAQDEAQDEGDRDGRGAVTAQNLLLVLMLSLSALVLAATALMLAGAFSGSGTLVVLAALTSAAALCPAPRAERRPGTPPAAAG